MDTLSGSMVRLKSMTELSAVVYNNDNKGGLKGENIRAN